MSRLMVQRVVQDFELQSKSQFKKALAVTDTSIISSSKAPWKVGMIMAELLVADTILNFA